MDEYKQAPSHLFKKIVDDVREKGDMFKANIHPYSSKEYSQMKTFLSPDGKSGYALKPDGELVSVFSLEKGRGDNLVRHAVSEGASKLDAYDIRNKLPDLYKKHGFEEMSRSKFNPEYAEDLDILKNEQPDFVTMERKPKSQLDEHRKLRKAENFLQENRPNMSDEQVKIAEEHLNARRQVLNKQSRGFFDKDKQVVNNTTEKIRTDESTIVKGSGDRYKTSTHRPGGGVVKDPLEKISKIKAVGKLAKKGLKMLPIVGGVATALATNDAAAAVPFLGDSAELGPEKGSLDRKLESGDELTPEEMERLKSSFQNKEQPQNETQGMGPEEKLMLLKKYRKM